MKGIEGRERRADFTFVFPLLFPSCLMDEAVRVHMSTAPFTIAGNYTSFETVTPVFLVVLSRGLKTIQKQHCHHRLE